MPKFRKKPVVISAERFEILRNGLTWPQSVYADESSPTGYSIKTLEGKHEVTLGDWIITGVKNEQYPCKPDIFELTYDAVEE